MLIRECETNRQLAEWRIISAELAKTEGVVFRRLFLTTDSPDVWNNFPIPRRDIFNNQLNLYVWTLRDDRNMEIGLEKDLWEKIAREAQIGSMAPNINIRRNRPVVFVSDFAEPGENYSCTVEGGNYVLARAKSLREIVVNGLHNIPITLTARITKITKEMLDQYDLRPTDLLLIGLIPEGTELTSNPLIKDMIPLIGVECLTQDPFSNISVLSLYNGKQVKDNLEDWINLLESNSSSLEVSDVENATSL